MLGSQVADDQVPVLFLDQAVPPAYPAIAERDIGVGTAADDQRKRREAEIIDPGGMTVKGEDRMHGEDSRSSACKVAGQSQGEGIRSAGGGTCGRFSTGIGGSRT